MDQFADSEGHLIEAMAAAARGPKRNALFALWLVVRVCAGYLPPDPPRERGQRARLQAVERRLSSLTLPPPLRRALVAALRELKAHEAAVTGIVLQQLVAPARESVGPEAADALAVAARVARTAMHAAART